MKKPPRWGGAAVRKLCRSVGGHSGTQVGVGRSCPRDGTEIVRMRPGTQLAEISRPSGVTAPDIACYRPEVQYAETGLSICAAYDEARKKAARVNRAAGGSASAGSWGGSARWVGSEPGAARCRGRGTSVESFLGAVKNGGAEEAHRIEDRGLGLGGAHRRTPCSGRRSGRSGPGGGECAWGIWRCPERPVSNMAGYIRIIQYIEPSFSIACMYGG